MLTRLLKRKAPSSAFAEEPVAANQQADRLIEQGQPLEDRGEPEAALRLYREAIRAAPSYARAHMNAANALGELKRWDEAEAAHRQALKCAPDRAEARFNLGAFLMKLGKFAEAEQELLAASRLGATMVEAPIALADLYQDLDRMEDAETQFANAIRIEPTHAGALFNYGIFCLAQGRHDDAMQMLERAKAVEPGFRDAESAVLFALNFRTDLSAETISARHRAIGALISDAATPRFTSWDNSPDPERRLRVGYVSGDFVVHPVALFLLPILANHRRRFVETYCYSSYPRPNPVADSLRSASAHWRDLHDTSDVRLAEIIRRDEIDILVDLSGHTTRNRLTAFAFHPAPVQFTWLGYLNTTGLEAMDYRICDRHTDPPGVVEHLYTEKLLRMPDSQWCYMPWREASAVPPATSNPGNSLIFGSFNQAAKISDRCLQAWARILTALPAARLLALDMHPPAVAKRLLERAARFGVSPERIELRGRESIQRYYAAIASTQIALDTFPYNGATTTLDALWMGVPVVALHGDRSIARGAYSILKTLGAEELIAHSVDEYVDLNVRLASDEAWRAQLHATLRDRMRASALMDVEKFVAGLEQRYRDAWRAWCASRASSLDSCHPQGTP